MSNNASLVIEIARHTFLIECHQASLIRHMREFYMPYLVDTQPRYRVRLMPQEEPGPNAADEISIKYDVASYNLVSSEFSIAFDCTKGDGTISIFSHWPLTSVINAIKNITVFIVLNEGGIVFHASGIARDDRAYIFCGSSGSGKSTIARRSQEKGAVLSEELIGILSTAEGLKAFGIPYTGDLHFTNRTSRMYEVAAMFTLRHHSENALLPIKKSKALAQFFILPAGFEAILSPCNFLTRCYNVIESIPCYELHFLPDASFWECIEASIKGERHGISPKVY